MSDLPPIRLNLACGPHEVDGYENLDASTGWRFEDGLPYDDASAEAIHIGHGLMYVKLADWPAVFAELARVLKPGGIVRVTEDDTENPESERHGDGIWRDAVTATGPKLVAKHMRAASLKVTKCAADTTGFKDRSLLQAWHGDPPKVFFCEGRKPDAKPTR